MESVTNSVFKSQVGIVATNRRYQHLPLYRLSMADIHTKFEIISYLPALHKMVRKATGADQVILVERAQYKLVWVAVSFYIFKLKKQKQANKYIYLLILRNHEVVQRGTSRYRIPPAVVLQMSWCSPFLPDLLKLHRFNWEGKKTQVNL